MELFDDFIINSDYSNSVKVTWIYIASINDLENDDYQQPDWDASDKTTETFFAIPVDNRPTEYARRKFGLTDTDDPQLIVPGEKDFNRFAHLGINDRITFNGRTYEVKAVNIDDLFDQRSKVITLDEETGL